MSACPYCGAAEFLGDECPPTCELRFDLDELRADRDKLYEGALTALKFAKGGELQRWHLYQLKCAVIESENGCPEELRDTPRRALEDVS